MIGLIGLVEFIGFIGLRVCGVERKISLHFSPSTVEIKVGVKK